MNRDGFTPLESVLIFSAKIRRGMGSLTGFTLIEIMIASLILSIILGALYFTFFLSHKAIHGLDEAMIRLQETRGVLDMLKREIDSCFYKKGDKNTFFKLQDRDIYGKQASRLNLTTLSPQRPGLSEIRYLVRESEGRLILSKEVSTPFGHEENKEEADILEDIEEFLIEARDGDKWIKTWDSSLMHRVPEEIKVSLKVKIKERQLLLFVTARPRII